MTLKVGIDLDDVVFNLMDSWLSMYNKDYEDDMTKEEIINYYLGQPQKNGREFKCGSKIYQYLYDPRLHLEPSIMFRGGYYADVAIRRLMDAGDVDITFITSAPRTVMPAKIHRLERIFPSKDYAYGLYMTNDKSRLDCDVFVDDGPKNFWNIVQKGARVLLFDQPWNRHIDVKAHSTWRCNPTTDWQGIRVSTWFEIVTLINELRELY